MAVLHIVRGPAPLPVDLEEQFRRAYGREMNEMERRFYGLESKVTTNFEEALPNAA